MCEFHDEPKVGIIILTHNQCNLTLDCLKSLYGMDYKNWFVIVVDNGSTDGTEQAIYDNFPEVVVIKNKTNLGVAGGRNKGIPVALQKGAEWILLLDNDTLVDRAFLRELVKVAITDPQIWGVAPKVYYAEYPDILDSAGGKFYKILFHARCLGSLKQDREQYNAMIDVDWIPGCAGFFKPEAFQTVGYLDQRFTPYAPEDVDFSLRVKQAGFRLVLAPSARVYHRRPPGKGFDLSKIKYSVRGRVLLLLKHAGLFEMLTGFVWLIFYATLYAPIRSRALRYFSARYYANVFLGLRDGLKEKNFGDIPLAPKYLLRGEG